MRPDPDPSNARTDEQRNAPAAGEPRPSLRARFGGLLGVLAMLVLAVWLIGRVVSDRSLWSQYLSWMPTEAAVGLAVVFLLLGALLGIGARRPRRPRRWVPVFAVVASVAWLLLGEWHLHRLVLPSPERGETRLVFMNISNRGATASIDPIFDANADIVVMSNVHPQWISFEKIYGVSHASLMQRSVGIVPGEAPAGDAHMVRAGTFHVYSKHPIRRRVAAFLGAQESWIEGDRAGGGSVLLLEIETPEGPLVVWAVDMPSTVGASRRSMFEQITAKIDTLTAALSIDEVGRWIPSDLSPVDSLRTPDVVAGDFNTPTHAWSIERFTPGLRDARADAGVGPQGTFPAGLPLPFPPFAIDGVRLGPSVRATHFETLEGDGCRHLGIVVDLSR